MKKTIILFTTLTFILTNICYAQNKKNQEPPLTLYTNESGSYIYDTIIEFQELKKEELYDRAKKFILSNVRTNDNNFKFDDENKSEINTDVGLSMSKTYNGTSAFFKLNIMFKEGKCKIIAQSFLLQIVGRTIYEAPLNEINLNAYSFINKKKVYKGFDEVFSTFMKSLNESLITNPKTDW